MQQKQGHLWSTETLPENNTQDLRQAVLFAGESKNEVVKIVFNKMSVYVNRAHFLDFLLSEAQCAIDNHPAPAYLFGSGTELAEEALYG